MENLIIYGGSFDPIHNGHLRIARAASLAYNADVLFVPAQTPRWKEPEASAEQRVEMLRLALKENGGPSFSIDLIEINEISEVNYTVNTVKSLKKKYKDREMYFLIGADQVNAFPKWKDPEIIASLVKIVYCPRPGVEIDDSIVERYSMLRLPYDGSGPVSSTAVRNLQDIDIPLTVRDYIEKNGLYYMKKVAPYLTEHRLNHSLSVANLAYRIALKNQVEGYHKAYIAGLLHDIGKNMPISEQRKIIREHFPEHIEDPEWSYHQFVGSYIAEHDFGIKDEAILDAIRYHATGKRHMSPLGKIIYASDKIEPTRGYNSRPLINACLKNYYVGFITVLEANREFLASKGYRNSDCRLSLECMDLYLGENEND